MNTTQKTATQQALIQFVESIVITAIIAGIVSISSALTGTGAINWREVGLNFGLAVAFSLAHSLTAYLKAMPATGQIDLAGLGAAIEALTGIAQQRVQPAQTQAKPIAAAATAQPVHGPLDVSTVSTTQPSVDGVQHAIPAFADTATMAAISTASTGGPTSPLVATETQH
jgi:hypothetical protein